MRTGTQCSGNKPTGRKSAPRQLGAAADRYGRGEPGAVRTSNDADVSSFLSICRVENWRAQGRWWVCGYALSLHGGFTVPPWSRFQFPPRQSERADFPHSAFLPASSQGSLGLSCGSAFGVADPIIVEQPEFVIEPAPIPPLQPRPFRLGAASAVVAPSPPGL